MINGKFKSNSDIDLVVDFSETDPIAYSDSYFNLKNTFEEIFNRHVDLLEQKALRNPYLKKRLTQQKFLSMEHEIASWLADIKQAINEINEFLPDKKDFLELSSKKTKRAIERNIEIIGEAVNRILKSDPNFPLTNARKIVDTRNRISHGYDSVSEEIIWAIVLREIPNLDKEVNQLFDKLQ